MPCIDAWSSGQFAALDQNASDGAIRLTVLIRVPDAHDAAIGEPHPPGALDLQEKGFDRVVDVEQFLARDRRLSRLDIGTRPVRHHALAIDARAHALVLEFGIEFGQVDGEQVVG